MFLFNKTNRPLIFQNIFLSRNPTCFGQFLCPSSGVLHCTFGTGIRVCHASLMTYTSAKCRAENSWWWPEELPEIYRVSQEECTRLREGVHHVKVYRYNPKHLCPKLNGYGDNGQRKMWSSGGSTHCTSLLRALSMLRRWVWYHMTGIQLTLAINRICTSFRVMT